ncbi:MAG: periplasmic heavy metal sensor [Balneola sp.]|nr:periplasmic heavy metal sensor [Balneola sp.]MBO6649724.1 periplasmic heavy metal sensor [Balneola sp.]MBO6712286.1 periplasmic heavy metal sensor [Balneola sp.]MBO6800480.1 periplasmic heavy metal sensor [Balneola sp.]MBO6871434.1 periplasmic heavy metal sensor [Balneola sp.]
MGLFENKRFTIISISVLVLLNLILIGLVVGPELGKRDRDRRDGDKRRTFVEKELGFTEEQKQAYDSLNSSHRTETKEIQQKIDEKRREMFRLTRVDGVSIETVDSLTTEIGMLVSNMEFRTYEHISNIRALCTPEQLQKLDSLVQRMIKSRRDREGGKKEHVRRN